MIRTATAALCAFLLLVTAATAQAAPYDVLQGEWIGTMPDVPPEIGEATIHLNFVDEDTMVVTLNFAGEKETMELRYEATDDELTIYEEGEAEGEVASWEITDDGTLIIIPEEDVTLEFRRPG